MRKEKEKKLAKKLEAKAAHQQESDSEDFDHGALDDSFFQEAFGSDFDDDGKYVLIYR